MIKIVESKAVVLAILTVIAGVAGYWGANIPVTTIVGLLTPLMIAIGAAGWSDVVKAKAALQLEHDTKMHALMHGNMMVDLPHGAEVKRDADGRIPQLGFAKFSLMSVLALCGVLVFTQVNCNVKQEATIAVNDAISCLDTEAAAVKAGRSTFQTAVAIAEALGVAVATAVATGGDIVAAIAAAAEQYVSVYGEATVACVTRDLTTPSVPATAGSNAPTTAQPAPTALSTAAQALIAKKGWRYK